MVLLIVWKLWKSSFGICSENCLQDLECGIYRINQNFGYFFTFISEVYALNAMRSWNSLIWILMTLQSDENKARSYQCTMSHLIVLSQLGQYTLGFLMTKLIFIKLKKRKGWIHWISFWVTALSRTEKGCEEYAFPKYR